MALVLSYDCAMTEPKLFRFAPLRARTTRHEADTVLFAAGLGDLRPLRQLNRAADAPYHNAYHADCLVIQADEAARFYAARGVAVEAKALLAAAFFHDFDHSAGELDDDYNIAQACGAVARHLPAAAGASEAEVAAVCALIRPTRYPFSPVDPEALEARILRDADLMQVFETDAEALFRQYDGLRVEVGRRQGHDISRADFAEGMLEWWAANTKWLTAWGTSRAVALDFDARCQQTIASMMSVAPT